MSINGLEVGLVRQVKGLNPKRMGSGDTVVVIESE